MQSKNLNKFFYFFIYFISIVAITEVIHNKNLAYCSHIILASLAGNEEQEIANSTLSTSNHFYHIILEDTLGVQGQGITDSNPTPESEEKIRNISQYTSYISDFLEENTVFIILGLLFHIKRQGYSWYDSYLIMTDTQVEYSARFLFLHAFLHIAEKIPKYEVSLFTTNNIIENVISEIFFTIKAFLISSLCDGIYPHGYRIGILPSMISPCYYLLASLYVVRIFDISTRQLFYIILDISSKITNKNNLSIQNVYNNTKEFIAYYYHITANTTALISQNVYSLFSLFKDCVSAPNACLHIHYFSENYEYFYYKSLPYAVLFIVYLAAKKYNALLLQIQNPNPIITTPQPAEPQPTTATQPATTQGLALSFYCSICMDTEGGGGVYIMPCGHAFHVLCTDAHFQNNKRCPTCRREYAAGTNTFITITSERIKEFITDYIRQPGQN